MIRDYLAKRLVTDGMWRAVEPLIPIPARPQGGGRARIDDRRVLTAMAYTLPLERGWRYLDSEVCGVTFATIRKRFIQYCELGVWAALIEYGREISDPWPEQLGRAALERAAEDAEVRRLRAENASILLVGTPNPDQSRDLSADTKAPPR